MSVVGFDVGSAFSCIAAARNRGIDIITNDVSSRFTSTLVSFTARQRLFGEAAASNRISNLKNTVPDLPQLIGRKYLTSDQSNAQLTPLKNGDVGVKVTYMGQEQVFNPVHLMASFLGHLKETAENGLNAPVVDCVISVPVWMGERQRRAMLDAAEIAGLNCLRLINNTTAAALAYGITKSDLPEPDDPRHVCFVDMGYSSLSVAITDMARGQLNVKGVAFDPTVGGKFVDQILMDHFAKSFKDQYKLDVTTNAKAMHRLSVACEKAKKVLSANQQAPVNIECIMDDRDVSGMITREELESVLAPVTSKINTAIEQALQRAGLKRDQINVVEVIGGSSRTPLIRNSVIEFFGGSKDIITSTLNQDEAVARGCALQAAIASPAFKVRDFAVHEIATFPVSLRWTEPQGAEDSGNNSVDVFTDHSLLNAMKAVTFFRRDEAFEVEVYYKEGHVPPYSDSVLGRSTIQKVPLMNGGREPTVVRVKLKLNHHGLLSFEKAEVMLEENQEAPEAPSGEPMEQDGKAADQMQVDPKKPAKTKSKRIPVILRQTTSSMDSGSLDEIKKNESEMRAADREVIDTQHARNSLEEYIYEAREKIETEWSEYIDPSVKEPFKQRLAELEDWLYTDEGDAADKGTYQGKLNDLLKTGRAVKERFTESLNLPVAARSMGQTLSDYVNTVKTGGERYSHIATEELQKIVTTAEQKSAWLQDMLKKQESTPKYKAVIVTTFQIQREIEEFQTMANRILNTPKPAPPPAPKPAPAADGAAPEANGDAKQEEQNAEEMATN